MPIPFTVKKKDLPNYNQPDVVTPTAVEPVDIPNQTVHPKESQPEPVKAVETQPEKTPAVETKPEQTPEVSDQPEKTPEVDTVPAPAADKEVPSGMIEENCVVFEGKKIELKPTKLKYFRNAAAAGYAVVKAVPLNNLLLYKEGVIDQKRDADHVLFDFLVAAFDDVDFVRENYDNFTAELIDNVVKIFGRINHIEEKEEQARKNKEAQAKP